MHDQKFWLIVLRMLIASLLLVALLSDRSPMF